MKNCTVYSLLVKTFKYKIQTNVYEQICIQFADLVQIENIYVFYQWKMMNCLNPFP